MNKKNPAKQIYEASFEPRLKTYINVIVIGTMVLTVLGIVLIPLWLIFGRLYLNRYFDNLFCELTTRALHFKKGVMITTERTIPLDKIQDLTFKEGPVLKYFGLSSLRVETAGQSASPDGDMKLLGIVNASEFRQMVLEQRDEITYHRSGESLDSASSANHRLEPLMQEILETLKRIEKKS